jgi:hypothetical protein
MCDWHWSEYVDSRDVDQFDQRMARRFCDDCRMESQVWSSGRLCGRDKAQVERRCPKQAGMERSGGNAVGAQKPDASPDHPANDRLVNFV